MSPEIHWNWCLAKCGGDRRIALLMMESVVESNHDNGIYCQRFFWSQWVIGKRSELRDTYGIEISSLAA